MSRSDTPKSKLPLRSWRASLIRKRGQILGTVEAATRSAAEAAAIKTFQLSEDQRKRLVLQEQG